MSCRADQHPRRDPSTIHPHGRGELTAVCTVASMFAGSSPRAWGTLAGLPQHPLHHRFIPTGVGNSFVTAAAGTAIAVHPHGRGELVEHRAVRSLAAGSSPRAWGTRYTVRAQSVAGRFIPTGVGNSIQAALARAQASVHPHGRGELAFVNHPDVIRTGSSPRAWGTLRRRAVKQPASRFIPTGVGNSVSNSGHQRDDAVHPHGRGELRLYCSGRHANNGSSPRAWGTQRRFLRRRQPRRFIPTGVGNSLPPQPRRALLPVHPHGRGELAAPTGAA